MAKNFPYFKFIATEWMTGDIVFEELSTQGLFINICALYWQRNGQLSITDINKRFKNPIELENLTDTFFNVNDDFISIKFLDEQLIEANHISKINSENGAKGGRPKKPNANRTQTDRKAKKSKEEKEEEVNKNESKYKSFAHLSISFEEVEKLKSEYSLAQIDAILESIENYKNNKNYVSLYLTAKKWLAKEYPKIENNNGPSKTNQKIMIYDND